MAESNGKASGSQSIERAAAVLRTVATFGAGARLADVVAKTNLTKPTVHRILAGLMREGLIEQETTQKCYFLGPETFILGTIAAARYDVQDLALPALTRLAEISQDTAFLSVVRGLDVVYVQREEGAFPIRTHVLKVGDRHPIGVSSSGQAILAAMDDEAVERVIAANAKRIAEFYPRYTPVRLRKMVQQARSMGYALNAGLIWPGSWGISVAIQDAGGRPVGALNIAAVESRLQPDRQKKLAVALKREAKWLSEQLGKSSNLLQRRKQGG